MAQSHQLEPAFFRREYGRIVAQLVSRFGAHHLADIEDCVSFAMTQALSHWRKQGIPDRPGAWLSSVAKRKLIDVLRRGQRFHQDHEATEHLQSESSPTRHAKLADEIKSDLLRMLFLCCDADIAPQTQMVLALKTLCGFSTQEIALRLFLSPSAVHKRLSRGRSALRERWSGPSGQKPASAQWQALNPEQIEARLPAVLQLIYLLFNEGYSSIRGETPIRRGLCEEAIYLAQSLLALKDTCRPEVLALQALMHFHLARFEARVDEQGKVVLLEDQDRKKWDPAMIQEGMRLFTQATQQDIFSRYHAEAAIALQHCLAPSYEQTNWCEIAEFYGLLAQLNASPIYILNQAIALAQDQGAQAGIDLLTQSPHPAWLSDYYLWDATQGELHRRAGQLQQARLLLARALSKAPAGWERELIAARLAACGNCDHAEKEPTP